MSDPMIITTQIHRNGPTEISTGNRGWSSDLCGCFDDCKICRIIIIYYVSLIINYCRPMLVAYRSTDNVEQTYFDLCNGSNKVIHLYSFS